MFKKLGWLALTFLLALPSPVLASTASQGAIGYITTNCGSAPPPCFVQYGSALHLTASPTVTAGAYSTGQVVGGLVTFASVLPINGSSGFVQTAEVTVKTALTAPFDVLIFDTNPSNSTFTDNSALAVNVADLPSLAGVIHCTDLVSLGTPQLLQATNQALPFRLANSSTTLYAVIVIRGSETFASTSAVQLSLLVTPE